jgi:hypothetical protein
MEINKLRNIASCLLHFGNTLCLCAIFLKCCLVFINPVIEKEVWDIKYMESYCEHLICSTDFEQVNGNDKNQIMKMKSESTNSVWVSYISSWVARRSNINTLKSIYCACFHSIIKYGIIFGGGGWLTLPAVGRFYSL